MYFRLLDLSIIFVSVWHCIDHSIKTFFWTIASTNSDNTSVVASSTNAVTVELVVPCWILRQVGFCSCCIKESQVAQICSCYSKSNASTYSEYLCQLSVVLCSEEEIFEWWHCLFMYCWSVGNYFVRKKFSAFRETSSYVLPHPPWYCPLDVFHCLLCSVLVEVLWRVQIGSGWIILK